jgi:hypothetical protein
VDPREPPGGQNDVGSGGGEESPYL